MKRLNLQEQKWAIRSDRSVYQTPIFDLHEVEAGPESGDETGRFYVLNAPEWINVLPLTPDREVILVEQYRHGIEEVTLEIPGGMVDEGEIPEEAAKRELLEETGYSSGSWHLLGKASSNPAILNNFTHLYLAENCRITTRQSTDEFEQISIHLVPIHDFLEMVRNGSIHHAIVLAAVAHYLNRK
ncbi:MAG: NUDIX hydrolase [Balneolaceae bacterium]